MLGCCCAPLMGIPNPSPTHPSWWTHSLLQRSPNPSISLPLPSPSSPNLLSRAPDQLQNAHLRAQQSSQLAAKPRAGLMLQLSQVRSLSTAWRDVCCCWQSFIACTFTSRQRLGPKHSEQREPLSAAINERTSTLRPGRLKCFESSHGRKQQEQELVLGREGEKPNQSLEPSPRGSQRALLRGFTSA